MTEPDSFPVEDARKKFADILDGTQFRSTHTEITRRGKRAGYVVPPEWYDRASEALEENAALRRKVEELSAAKDARPSLAAPRPQVTQAIPESKPRRRPEPEARDGRPLTDEEAKPLAELARSRATEMQRRKLEQIAADGAKGYEDYAIVSSALDMGLLTHDEVYGAGSVRPDEEPT